MLCRWCQQVSSRFRRDRSLASTTPTSGSLALPGETRLYVAHTGADRVDVIDCTTNTYLHALPNLPGVARVLIDSEHDRLFSSDRGCARVSIFRCSETRALSGQVAVGHRPNGLA